MRFSSKNQKKKNEISDYSINEMGNVIINKNYFIDFNFFNLNFEEFWVALATFCSFGLTIFLLINVWYTIRNFYEYEIKFLWHKFWKK